MKFEEPAQHDIGVPAEPVPSGSLALEHVPMASLDVGLQQHGEETSDPKPSDFSSLANSSADLRHCHGLLARQADRFAAMGALDILRESIVVLRANSSVLMLLMLILICPVSGLLLSHTLLHGKLAGELVGRFYRGAAVIALLQYYSVLKSIYESLSQVFLTYVLTTPVLFTLWLLAKASIIHVVSATYTNKYVSLMESLNAGVKLWKRVACTYAWNCVLLVAFVSFAAPIFHAVVSVMDALQFSADLIFLMELALGLFNAVIFAQLLVVGNLAIVVSTLEDAYGFATFSRSFYLLKGKIQVGLSLFCGILLGAVMIESLYQYRVIGIPPTNYAINTASRMWEGPLLIFMYSFLSLLDAMTGCVLYFSCKSALLLPDNLYQTNNEHFLSNV